MSAKDKHEYFHKIGDRRLTRILEDLDALGGCSNPATYSYNSNEVEPMILEIYKKVAEIRQRLILRSPYSGVPFRLHPPDEVELAGHAVLRSDLASMDKVMALLHEGAPSFVSLEPVRTQYEGQFGDELCWNCPVFHDGHTGCILLPVQEGILYLPYNSVDSETFERFDLQGMGLLDRAQLERLLAALHCDTVRQLHILSDIQAYGLAQDDHAKEVDPNNDAAG